jgi:hypothetical protein
MVLFPPPIIWMPNPPERLISLNSMRLSLANSLRMPTPALPPNALLWICVKRVLLASQMPCELAANVLSRIVLPLPFWSASESRMPASWLDSRRMESMMFSEVPGLSSMP